MADDKIPPPPRRRSPLGLVIVSVAGLAGFVVAYVLLLERNAPAQQAPVAMGIVSQPVAAPAAGRPGPKGEQGPRGERGAAGPRGDSGVRIVRQECTGVSCSAKCDDDEMLLTAHCGTARLPAVYPSERTALCRSPSSAKLDVVAACVKMSTR